MRPIDRLRFDAATKGVDKVVIGFGVIALFELMLIVPFFVLLLGTGFLLASCWLIYQIINEIMWTIWRNHL